MESRAKLFGHAIHPILIVFPLGLLATAVVFDIIALVRGNGVWSDRAYAMIAAGVIGGVLAAVFGFIDWLAIPQGTRARSVGLLHAVVNDLALILFAASWWLRRTHTFDPGTLALVCSFAGAGVALVGGWLGGELVERLGVGVDDGAHLDAPSSLSGRPASDAARSK